MKTYFAPKPRRPEREGRLIKCLQKDKLDGLRSASTEKRGGKGGPQSKGKGPQSAMGFVRG